MDGPGWFQTLFPADDEASGFHAGRDPAPEGADAADAGRQAEAEETGNYSHMIQFKEGPMLTELQNLNKGSDTSAQVTQVMPWISNCCHLREER